MIRGPVNKNLESKVFIIIKYLKDAGFSDEMYCLKILNDKFFSVEFETEEATVYVVNDIKKTKFIKHFINVERRKMYESLTDIYFKKSDKKHAFEVLFEFK